MPNGPGPALCCAQGSKAWFVLGPVGTTPGDLRNLFSLGFARPDVHMNMSNAAVIQIIQHNTGTIGANNNSDFTVRLLNPDDYTDLRCLPGLAVTEWPRWNEDDAVALAVDIGEILTQNRVAYRVEWL